MPFAAAMVAATSTSAAGGASNDALAKAAQAARLEQIDDFRKQCDDRRIVAEWLRDVLGDGPAKVRWTGGRCALVNDVNPPDAGAGWCGRAEIRIKGDKKPATIEIFFKKPARGKPETPFAFRAAMLTIEGWDYMRETYAFEVNWKRKHWKNYQLPANQECD